MTNADNGEAPAFAKAAARQANDEGNSCEAWRAHTSFVIRVCHSLDIRHCCMMSILFRKLWFGGHLAGHTTQTTGWKPVFHDSRDGCLPGLRKECGS
jgi:hypothetical protein